MIQYHKIPTMYARDPETKYKTLMLGVYATDELQLLRQINWTWTEKVDGTNIRIMINTPGFSCTEGHYDASITFGGKTNKAQLPAALVTHLQEKYLPLADRLHEQFPEGACLYGEGYGAKIQKDGELYRDDQSFVMFDVKIGDIWLARQSVEDIGHDYDIDVVPIYGYGDLKEFEHAIRRENMRSFWGDFEPEGLVAKPFVELQDRQGQRIITKLKMKDFR